MRSLIAFVLFLGVSASGIMPAAGAPPMVVGGQTVELTEQVYLIPDRRVPLVPNIGIVVGSEGVLVIDTGMGPANANIVLGEVRKITDLPIRYLVCTHFHPEHNFGAQSFPDETIVIYSSAEYRDLKNKGEVYRNWFVDMFADDVSGLLGPVELRIPDVTFENKAEFDLGGLPVELYHFGYAAHTGGDTVVYLPKQRIVFAGGLTPNGAFPIFPDEDSSAAGWIESLNRLEMLDASRIVPGHGDVAEPALIDTVRRYLEKLTEAALELKSEGVSLDDAKARLSPRFEQEYGWNESFWIANAIGVIYAEAGSSP